MDVEFGNAGWRWSGSGQICRRVWLIWKAEWVVDPGGKAGFADGVWDVWRCRFYEAVVELPLRKARAVDPSEDAFNESIDEGRRQSALVARRQCYDVVTNALRSLKGQSSAEIGSTKVLFSASGPGARLLLDEAARESYIRQIVQLGVRWPDNAFHECLYETMIELGLTQELLDLGGPDLVTFLQNAGNYQTTKVPRLPRFRQREGCVGWCWSVEAARDVGDVVGSKAVG